MVSQTWQKGCSTHVSKLNLFAAFKVKTSTMCKGQIIPTAKAIPVEFMGFFLPKSRQLLKNVALKKLNIYACIPTHTELLTVIHSYDYLDLVCYY